MRLGLGVPRNGDTKHFLCLRSGIKLCLCFFDVYVWLCKQMSLSVYLFLSLFSNPSISFLLLSQYISHAILCLFIFNLPLSPPISHPPLSLSISPILFLYLTVSYPFLSLPCALLFLHLSTYHSLTLLSLSSLSHYPSLFICLCITHLTYFPLSPPLSLFLSPSLSLSLSLSPCYIYRRHHRFICINTC